MYRGVLSCRRWFNLVPFLWRVAAKRETKETFESFVWTSILLNIFQRGFNRVESMRMDNIEQLINVKHI